MTTRPDGAPRLLLQRVRDLFLILAVTQLIPLIISVLAAESRPLALRLATAAVVAGWIGWWVVARRLSGVAPWLRLLEWPIFAAPAMFLIQNVSLNPLLIISGLIIQGTYGGRRVVAARVAAAAGLVVTGIVVAPAADGRDFAQLGAVVLPGALYLLKCLLEQYDRLVRREAALRVGAETAGALLDRGRLYEVAVDTALSLASSVPASRVSLAIGTGDERVVVSSAGSDPGDRRVVIPLRSRGREIGAYEVESAKPVPEEILAGLVTWATTVAASVENIGLHEELRRRAFHDPLTGLPNRDLLDERLAQSIATCPPGEQVGYLLIDLNEFKPVNDRYGHHAGDELLRQVAVRLSTVVRAGDAVGRLGGDEFGVVLPGLPHPAIASGVADRMIDALQKPFHLGSLEVVVGASIGIAFADPVGTAPDTEIARGLVRSADAAMYRAKARHVSGWLVDDPDLKAAAR